jgi:hypothetical protein
MSRAAPSAAWQRARTEDPTSPACSSGSCVRVTLMDGEWCEEDTSPVVSMLIRQGTVELVDPKVRNIHEESGRNPTAPEDHGLECLWVPPAEREHAISLEQIREWGRTFSKNIPSGRNSFRSVDNSPCLKAGDSWFIQQPLRRLSLTRCPTGVRDSDVSHPI